LTTTPYGFPDATSYRRPVDEKCDIRRTFYFSKQQLVDFGLVQMQLSLKMREEIDKSQLMQLALDVLIEEVNANGASGLFGQRLATLLLSRSVGRTRGPAKNHPEEDV